MQMRNRWFIFVLLIVIVVGAGEAFAQRGRGRVSGTVRDTEGNTIEGAKIVAIMANSDFSLEATSDEKGRFAILGFRKGSYQFTVSAPRHHPQEFTSQVSGLGSNPSLDVTLEPMTSGEALVAGPEGELLSEANALFDANDYTGALAKYEQVLAAFPDLYQIHMNMGNCYRDMGDTEKAMAEYNLVLEQEPNHIGVMVNIGEMAVKQGDLEKAISIFENALETAPDDEAIPFNVAEIYFGQGNVEKAIEYYRRSSELRPDWPDPLLKLGYAYLNLADMENAAAAFEKVIEVAPDTQHAQMAEAALSSIQQ
jgi:tetratricopeptide (TPR) repeat protein